MKAACVLKYSIHLPVYSAELCQFGQGGNAIANLLF